VHPGARRDGLHHRSARGAVLPKRPRHGDL